MARNRRARTDEQAETAPAENAAPDKRRSKAERSDAAPLVPLTVLNFIEEDLHNKAAARRSLGLVVAFFVVAAAIVGGAGALLRVQADVAKQVVATEESRNVRNLQDIATVVREASGGVLSPKLDLAQHLTGRRAQLSAALAADTDVSALTAAIEATLPPGTALTSLSVDGGVAGAAKNKAATPATTPAPAAGGATSKPATQKGRTVEVTAVGADYQSGLTWQASLQRLGVFSSVTVKGTEKDGQVTFTAVAQLSPGAYQPRSADLVGDVGPAMTPTTTPQPGDPSATTVPFGAPTTDGGQ
jgi:Tfp pilus assembly protein PilN